VSIFSKVYPPKSVSLTNRSDRHLLAKPTEYAPIRSYHVAGINWQDHAGYCRSRRSNEEIHSVSYLLWLDEPPHGGIVGD
jgi:hypothetical protein